jgi:hypothetical protein
VATQKWIRHKLHDGGPYEYELKQEYLTGGVLCAWVEFAHWGYPTRRSSVLKPLYSVLIVGNKERAHLARRGARGIWTLATAKRKAKHYADYQYWLMKHGIIKCPTCDDELADCPDCEWIKAQKVKPPQPTPPTPKS